MANKPHDELRAVAAPRELIEWVRKMPPETALRTAWVDTPRADWLPYLAIVRGLSREAILRATAACAVERAVKVEGPQTDRLLQVLRAVATEGRAALATTEADLHDLKLAIIAWGHRTQPRARPAWMPWAELVLELARAASRGNVVIGCALAMRLLVHAKASGRPNDRLASSELVARFREQVTML
ncbi:MAG: hypothetical protein AB7O24_13655 [Kofleriaceae bacterium]